MTSAWSMAVSICRSTCSVRLSTSSMPMPPVSTSSKKRSPTWTSVETRSRVTPAVGSTMAMRRPASQLNSDDLPTLGRPTMATTGTVTSRTSVFRCVRRAGALLLLYRIRRDIVGRGSASPRTPGRGVGGEGFLPSEAMPLTPAPLPGLPREGRNRPKTARPGTFLADWCSISSSPFGFSQCFPRDLVMSRIRTLSVAALVMALALAASSAGRR